jgi:hypothetical protein
LFFFPKIWTGSCDLSDSASSRERFARAADTVFMMLNHLVVLAPKIAVSLRSVNRMIHTELDTVIA